MFTTSWPTPTTFWSVLLNNWCKFHDSFVRVKKRLLFFKKKRQNKSTHQLLIFISCHSGSQERNHRLRKSRDLSASHTDLARWRSLFLHRDEGRSLRGHSLSAAISPSPPTVNTVTCARCTGSSVSLHFEFLSPNLWEEADGSAVCVCDLSLFIFCPYPFFFFRVRAFTVHKCPL